jgi:CHASE1-domain containing sensor protein
MEWLPTLIQIVTMFFTLVGFVVAVTSKLNKLESRIDLLSTEIRKDRELVEHRIRQLSRLSYSVGGLHRQEHKTTEDMS